MPFAKIAAPLAVETVHRPRLHRILDDALQHPLLWVSGPGGCGKTTLVSADIAARDWHCAWYQVDAGDADPGALFHYLPLACEQADPVFGKADLPVFGPHLLPAIGGFAPRYFRELFARLGAPFAVVLDNLHEAPADALLFELLRAAASEIPAGGHLILLSRSEVHPLLARFLANGRMARLGWDELRFREDEAVAMLQRPGGPPRATEDLRLIVDAAHGWAAALRLMGVEETPVGRDPFPATMLGQTLFDYLASEVFDRLDPSGRDFLLRTAFLPKIGVGPARELTGNAQAGRLLNDLTRRNFFTVRRPPGDVFEYHPLLRVFLRRLVESQLGAAELVDLKRRAASILAAGDQAGDAAGLIIGLRDWPALAVLLADHAPELLEQTRHRTVECWLRDVPPAALDGQPWLLYWLGLARTPFAPAQAQADLERAYARFRQNGDAAGAWLSWAAVVDLLTSFNTYGPELDAWLDAFDELAADCAGFPSREIECKVATSFSAGLEYVRPLHPQRDYWGQRALELARELGKPRVVAQINLNRLLTLAFSTQTPERAAVIDTLRSLVTRSDTPPLDHVRAIFGLCANAVYAGRVDEAIALGNRGLDVAEREGITAFTPLILWDLHLAYLLREDEASATSIIARMAQMAESVDDRGRVYLHAAQASQEYLRGNLALARNEILAGLAALGPNRMTYAHTVAGVLAIHIASEMGRAEEAEAHLVPLSEFARQMGNPLLDHHCQMCAAEIELNRGNELGAVAVLRNAMALAREVDVHFIYTWRPATLAKLCVLALENGIEPDTVRRIARVRKLRADPPPLFIESWPWDIQIRTLGRFSVDIEGVPLALPERAHRKPLELLKALVAFGDSRGAPVVALQDALWPDAEGDAAAHSFEMALSRLRKLIEVPGAFELGGGALFLAPHLCRVDAWALREFVSSASAALSDPARAHSAADLERMEVRLSALDGGPFLGLAPHTPWAPAVREALASSVARLLQDLGGAWAHIGQAERARACWQRGLRVEGAAAAVLTRLRRALDGPP